MGLEAPTPQPSSGIAPYSKHPSELRPYELCPPPTKTRASCQAIGTPSSTKLRAYALPVPSYEGSGERKGWSPTDLRSAYNLPSTGGKGLTVAITIAYDDPKAEEDLATYRSHYGLSVCTAANGCFKKVNQKGETANYPKADADWATETSLDLDMVSAACPECHILLVEADNNYLSPLYIAVEKAAELGANVISNSWASEEYEEETEDDEYFHHPGTPILFASGDEGYWMEYPAASREVVAVGGTSLKKDKSARGWSEGAWNAAGSGCSKYEEKPAWQSDEGCAKRTVSDVSAVADPATPVSVYDSYEGEGWELWGGTSVATPLMAGVEALSSSEFRAAGPEAFTRAGEGGELFDPTEGETYPCRIYLCQAEAGYDGPTGWGTPNGPLSMPVAITEAAKTASASEAALHGAVKPGGIETEYRFEYGESTSYGTTVSIGKSSAAGYVKASKTISGLKGQKTYHYRISATRSKETFYGLDRTFGTTPPGATTEAASEVHANDVTLKATVNPEGIDTTYYFEYGKTSNYESTEPPAPWGMAPSRAWGGKKPVDIGSGTTGVKVSAVVGVLAPSQTYHYRVVAANAAGTTYGKDTTVTTSAPQWQAEKTPQLSVEHELTDISCVSSSDCMAIGEEYWGAFSERWHGGQWTQQTMAKAEGATSTWPTHISCVSTSWCMAVGESYNDETGEGQALAEHWNGKEWTIETLPLLENTHGSVLTDLSCASASACVAVGAATVQSGGKYIEHLVAERWDGQKWAVETLDPSGATSGKLNSVSCADGSYCVTVGYYQKSSSHHLLAELWNGTNWSVIRDLTSSSVGSSAVSCAVRESCMAVGVLGTATLLSGARWNGSEWTAGESPPVPTGLERLSAGLHIACPAANFCEATGYGVFSGSSIVPVALSWDGSKWTWQTTPEPGQEEEGSLTHGGGAFTDVSCVSVSWCTSAGWYFSTSLGRKTGMVGIYEAPGPRVTISHASPVRSAGATLKGNVNPKALSTTYQFEYGTSKAYGVTLPTSPANAGSGSEAVAVSQAIHGLEPLTEYHYRLKATNSKGTTYSEDGTFKTRAVVPPHFSSSFGELGSAEGKLDEPYGIAIGSEDNIWVADSENSRVEKFSSSGKLLRQVGTKGSAAGQFKEPYAITAGAEGKVWVADSFNNRLVELDSSGNFVKAIGWGVADGKSQFETCTSSCQAGIAGSGEGQVNYPYGITADPQGDLWVANWSHRAEEFSPEGKFVRQFNPGSGSFFDIALDEEGHIWIADYTGHIREFNAEGKLLLEFGKAGSGDGELNMPTGLGIDPDGRIWVADTENDRVQIFSSSGHYLAKFGESGSGAGQMNFPRDVAFDSQGNAWVADSENSRIEKWATSTPEVSTEGASAVKASQATLNATVNPKGSATTYYFEYDKAEYQEENEAPHGTKFPLTPEAIGSGTSSVSVHQTLTGLAEGTTYHYRVAAENEAGISYGEDKSFTTLKLPKAITEFPEAVKATSARLWGRIEPEGSLTSYYFEYDKEKEYKENETTPHGTKIPLEPEEVGSDTSLYFRNQTLTGLAENTTYHYRVIAESAAGTAYGKDRAFTTLKLPKAITEPASEVIATAATLNGTVNPEGSATSYYFEYDTSEYKEGEGPHGTKIPTSAKEAGSGTANVSEHETPTGLSAGTTYHFRLVAESFAGAVRGKDKEFTILNTVGEINALPTLDALTRTENPLSNGGKWSALAWATNATGHPTGKDTETGWAPTDLYTAGADGAYWNHSTFSDKSGDAAALTMQTSPGSENRYLALWLDMGSPGSSKSGYQLRWIYNPGGTYTVKLSKWSSGTETVLASNASVTIATGTTMAISDTGGTVTAWQGTGSSLTSILSAGDTTFSEGYAGIEGAGNVSRSKNFKAGRLLGGAISGVSVLDDLEREEYPLATGKWTKTNWAEQIGGAWASPWRGYGAYANHLAGAYWNPTTFSDSNGPLVVAATLGTGPTAAGEYLSLWLDMPNPGSARSGYEARLTGVDGSSNYKVELSKWVAGTRTVLGSKEGFSLPLGTTMALTETGGALALWTGTSSFSPVLSANDSTYSSGYAGLEANYGEGTEYDFRAGEVG